MIFVEGDQAIYEGSATQNDQRVVFGGILIRGQMVVVVWSNEDDEDDVIVRKLSGEPEEATFSVQASDLNWREGPSYT